MTKTAQLKEIYSFLKRLAPEALAEPWDNIGLQVGSLEEVVSGILVSLDATEAVLWEAVEHEANLVVTHHPLIFKAIKRLDDSTASSRILRLAVQMDLNVMSFHTNLDSTQAGLNDALARTIGVQGTRALIPSRDPKNPKAGLGRIGSVPKTSLKNFLSHLSKRLSLNELRYVGDLRHPIKKVAVMTGSGGDFFLEAQQAGADVLVTGDVKYHQALDSQSEGIALVDIGHYAGEIGMVPLVSAHLRSWLKKSRLGIKVFESQVTEDPFRFWSRLSVKSGH